MGPEEEYNVEKADENGNTRLLLAASAGDDGLVRELLEKGTSLYTYMCIHVNMYMCIRVYILSRFTCPLTLLPLTFCFSGANVHAVNGLGTPATCLVAWKWVWPGHGHMETLRALVKGGADIDALDGQNGYTALMYAGYNGNVALVRVVRAPPL
jgi:ankyrin repeat protein